MSAFGFTFEALYGLEVDELRDLARLIRGDSYYPPQTKEVLIRGVVIPFLREASRAPKDATKDEVMCSALIHVAKALDVSCEDWDNADRAWIVEHVRRQWEDALRRRFRDLDDADRQEILRKADEELERSAQRMGVSLVPAAGIIAGELSGFGIYLATTTGLGAISSAIGVTFPWVVYQGATTMLGMALGPIGWALAGAGVLAGGAAFLAKWLNKRQEKIKVVVIAIIEALGDNPYEWFGLTETAPMESVKTAYRAMMKTFHPDKLDRGLPDWVMHRFNGLLLQTQENYEQIKRHKEEVN